MMLKGLLFLKRPTLQNKHMKLLKTLILGFLLLTGCDTIQHGIGKISGLQVQREKEIAALRADFDRKIEIKVNEISNSKDGQIKARDSQIIAAANHYYARIWYIKQSHPLLEKI